MNVGSLFSGIGGLDYGLRRAGWHHTFLCESDEWRRGVLRARFPGVPVYDDVREVAEGGGAGPEPGGYAAQADLLCGGFPCQDLSVAGQRRGLAGDRSSLFYEFARIADTLRPQLLLIENVPGLLSSNGGRDFGSLLGTLADIGYGVGWRTLDSRFFGVPQRRRRVFIVGVLAHGDPARAAERAGEILAVGQGCDRHLAKGGEAGPSFASALSGRSASRLDDQGSGQLVAGPLTAMGGKNERGYRIGVEEASGGFIVPTLAPALQASQAIGDPHDQVAYVIAAPLSHGSNPNSNMAGRRREDDENLDALGLNWQTGGDFRPMFGDQAPALQRNQTIAAGVRRLTPVECERLQALPDNWTRVPDTAPDSRRYAALGDAVTASVAEWIGRRLLNAASVSSESAQ